MFCKNLLVLYAILTIGSCGVIDAGEPQSVADAITCLQERARQMISGSRRAMKDGVAAFPPQVGGGYEAFWLRDYEYMLEGCPEAFSDREVADACMVFINAQRADGACVDCVKFDGTPIYMPGYGTMGENPVADGSMFTVGVAWHTYQKTKDRQLVKRIADSLVKAMNATPRDPRNGLVFIRPGGHDRCPYGFTDGVKKQGDELFCSLLYVNASHQLADLLDLADRPDDANKWRAEAARLIPNIQSVFWDEKIGLFRAATLKCKEPDIWGSAFAVYLDVATKDQAMAIAHYFKQHYDEIVYHGQIRHLPGGVYWEHQWEGNEGKKDFYQNGGFWATPAGWFAYTLDLVDSQLADHTVVALARELPQNAFQEWVCGEKKGIPNYLASVALPIAGIKKMLERRAAAGAASGGTKPADVEIDPLVLKKLDTFQD